MTLSIKMLAGCALLSLVFVACSGSETDETGSGGGNQGSSSTSGTTGAGTGATTGTGSGSFTCCLDDTNYSCPNQAAFDKCVGFDIDGCLMACDPADFTCIDGCFEQANGATHDPSDCTEDASAQCTPGPGSCEGTYTGQMCDSNLDCGSQNCVDNKCYETANGNPCESNLDCGSQNCTDGCCYSNDPGSPCESNLDCSSQNCYNGSCQ